MSNLKPFGNHFYIMPLKVIYWAVISIRNLLYNSINKLSKDTGYFTISIGGIHAGGTGKTPMASLLGELVYNELSQSVIFLSRGYGREEKKCLVVKSGEKANWKKTGDEPALLKNGLPESILAIGSNRLDALNLCKTSLLPSSTIIMDDGFQHRKVKRDLDIICLPPDPFKDFLIPAGTLREPISTIKRSSIICLIGSQDDTETMKKSHARLQKLYPEKRVFILYQKAKKWINLKNGEKKSSLPAGNKIAISGIARPERFLKTLASKGVSVSNSSTYADHHIFTKNDIERSLEGGGEIIVTTEKDAIRLSSLNLVNLTNIWYLKIILEFSDTDSRGDFCQHVTDLFNKRCKICKGK